MDQEFKELGVRTNPEEALSESTLNSSSKDTINLQSLRPMEANIFLTLYDIKVELTKVKVVSINPFTPKSSKFKTEEKILIFILQNCQK